MAALMQAYMAYVDGYLDGMITTNYVDKIKIFNRVMFQLPDEAERLQKIITEKLENEKKWHEEFMKKMEEKEGDTK